jgi:hypothetical protein
VFLLGGRALRERGLRAAAAIAEATGASLLTETAAAFPPSNGLPTSLIWPPASWPQRGT